MTQTEHDRDADGSSVTGGGATEGGASIREVLRKLGPAAWLGALWLVLPVLGSLVLFARIGPVSEWLNEHEVAGQAAYVGLFSLFAGFGLLPTYAQALLGGWAFGPVLGTVLALLGFTGGSLVGMAISRTVGRDRVEGVLRENPKWAAVRDALVRGNAVKTLGIVTLVRVPPNSPFSLTNLVLSTSGVPFWAYLTGTAVGMLPRTAVVVWLGSQIEGQFNPDVDKPKWMLFVGIGLSVLFLFVIAEIGKRALAKATAGGAGADRDG